MSLQNESHVSSYDFQIKKFAVETLIMAFMFEFRAFGKPYEL